MDQKVADPIYSTTIEWTGNKGTGTSGYREYGRDYIVRISGKPFIEGSSDPAFRGDPAKHNPEDLLLTAVSSCHMLWFLHLAADNGIIVTSYTDHATGVLHLESDGSGRFISIDLNPEVAVLEESMVDRCAELHQQANRYCFIANSLNIPVSHNGRTYVRTK